MSYHDHIEATVLNIMRDCRGLFRAAVAPFGSDLFRV